MQIIEITANKPAQKKKLEVAAYTRVSADNDITSHSITAQQEYYRNYITSHPDWELVGIYSDKGISGTIEDRPAFQKLLSDCRKKTLQGKPIDLIITKSITHFARNTLTLLTAIRELKSLNIDVFFEKEQLHSISDKGEMMITLLAMYAEEEARTASENVRWRVRRCFEHGEPWQGRTLGYKMVNHQLIIIPEEAKLIQEIFGLYLSGFSIRRITQHMREKYLSSSDHNVWSTRGRRIWNPSDIKWILSNEKYKGDLLLQKYYTPDFRTKKQTRNVRDYTQQYYVENAHCPIVLPETFDKVQEEMKRRSKLHKPRITNTTTCKNPFRGIAVCGECGFNYSFYREYKTGLELLRCHCKCTYGLTSCQSVNIPFSTLANLTKKLLHLHPQADITMDVVKRSIKKIIINRGELIYCMTNGDTIVKSWELSEESKRWSLKRRSQSGQHVRNYWNTKITTIPPTPLLLLLFLKLLS